MKTRIITLITMVAVVLSTTNFTYAAKATNNDQITVLTEVTSINKIEASGNVEVYITNGDKDQVKVYNNYYAQNALVQDKDGVLRVSSYDTDKLVVLVTVSDLRSITASDNAAVKSYGTLAAIDLTVNLKGNASAQLKLNSFAADITVTGHAKADLTGNVNDYNLNYTPSSSVNRSELAVVNKTEKILKKPVKAVAQDLDIDVVASL
jgi:hypothetical protein